MNSILAWASRHQIPQAALADLLQTLGLSAPPDAAADSRLTSEAGVQQQTVLRAQRYQVKLWRNNSGACEDSRGRQLRYGLGNVSAQVCRVFKSSDLIGITPVTCACGRGPYGLFTAREAKSPGWHYVGDRPCSCKPGRICQPCHEKAQFNFIKMVTSMGGLASFVSDPTTVYP